MKDSTLKKISLTKMKIINLEKGDVLHYLKNSSTNFNGFGEVYFSKIKPNVIKAWKLHKTMTLNLIVPMGKVRFVFFSETTKAFRIEEIGEENYRRLSVPPGIWFGFKGLSNKISLIANFADIEHDQNESMNKNINEINFDWNNL